MWALKVLFVVWLAGVGYIVACLLHRRIARIGGNPRDSGTYSFTIFVVEVMLAMIWPIFLTAREGRRMMRDLWFSA